MLIAARTLQLQGAAAAPCHWVRYLLMLLLLLPPPPLLLQLLL
jgi:hypothetical protein